MKWIPFPPPMRSVLSGRWMCTVQRGRKRRVQMLDLRVESFGSPGVWRTDDNLPLPKGCKVVAITYAPDPYGG